MGSTRSKSRIQRAINGLGFFIGFILISALTVVVIWWVNNRPPNIHIPGHPVPAVNGYDAFVRAGLLAKNVVHKAPMSLAPPQSEQAEALAHLKALVAELAPAHAALRAGLQLECVCPPVRVDNDPTWQHGFLFRELSRELTGEALYFEKTGRPWQAAEALLDGLEMGAALMRGGGYYNADRSVSFVCSLRLESLISNLSPGELAKAGSRLDRIIALRPSFADLAREQALESTAAFLDELRQPNGMSSYKTILECEESSDKMDEVRRSSIQRHMSAARFYIANKGRIANENLEYMKALAAEAERPFTGLCTLKEPDNLEMRWTLKLYNHSRVNYLREQAILAIFRTEVALLRYRAAFGQYPDSLSQLVPRFVRRLPDDPFGLGAGKPLRYVSTGKSSYELYSLGPDLTDDGGRPLNAQYSLAGYPEFGEDRGDYVAGKLDVPRPDQR